MSPISSKNKNNNKTPFLMVSIHEQLQKADGDKKKKKRETSLINPAAVAAAPTIRYSKNWKRDTDLSTHSSDVTSRHFYAQDKQAIPMECSLVPYFQQLPSSLQNCGYSMTGPGRPGSCGQEPLLSIHILKGFLLSQVLPADPRMYRVK
ncbi:uncharacterized protein LOC126949247 [Macaca thibetana thibetana]|uniref:uncharacterized protein LOC126949247 n=1 Tax=Macaca thibetana thibetana TaxID=257877 RepID=UPI0021BC9270|nr:uncharacterized protein LOC126949247 [Macaca thibetana thibetana]